MTGTQDLADRGREIIDARARHNDRVPAAMCFLGDPEKLAHVVLPEPTWKAFSRSELFGFDNVSFSKGEECRRSSAKWKQISRHLLRKTLNCRASSAAGRPRERVCPLGWRALAQASSAMAKSTGA